MMYCPQTQNNIYQTLPLHSLAPVKEILQKQEQTQQRLLIFRAIIKL